MFRALVLATIFGACGGDDGNPATGDARQADASHDAPTDTPVDCEHVLYLNYEGGTFNSGAADDARTNTTQVADPGTYTIAPYLLNDGARATKLQTITTQVQNTLAPYATVVTTRPQDGSYHMVVIGGVSQDLGFQSGIGALTAAGSCTVGVPAAITFYFAAYNDPNGTDLVRDANFVIGYYGLSKGVPASSSTADCMCTVGTCYPTTTACTIGGATTPRETSSPCGTGATFDETAAFTGLACD